MRANEASVSSNCFGCLQIFIHPWICNIMISCADMIIQLYFQLYFRQKFISSSTIQFNLNITYAR